MSSLRSNLSAAVAELPSGMVTFLVTDVEGATRMVDRHPEAGESALDRHRALVFEVVHSHSGVVFSDGGDAFGSAFANPLDAVASALEVQRRQRLEQMEEVGPLKVRMAIHSGVAQPKRGNYF